MTIRKRLFLSNILMIVIPAILSVLALAAGLLILFSTTLPDSGVRLLSEHETAETRRELTALAGEWLGAADGDARMALEERMAQIGAQNRMCVVLAQGDMQLQQFGSGAIPEQPRLLQALAALGGAGTVSDGETELFGARLTSGGEAFQLRVYNPALSIEERNLKLPALLFAACVVAAALLAVLLTNRFLTRFVFKNIAGPLQTLAEGVHQIRDGNLDFRIAYAKEDEFQPVCEDFNAMAERLRASVEQSQREEKNRKELLASISHDVRSPLTSIRAYVEGLLDGVARTPEKQRAYLTTIQEKAMEIDRLVKKIFLFSKMDMGQYPYSPERLEISREVEEFVRVSAAEYARRGLQICLGPLPPRAPVEADPTYFRSVLTNLLDNSARYRERTTGCARIWAERCGREILLYVDDDGPGVPEEALPKLFDVFYRGDPARNSPEQGSGLGLAIVWKIVERMGGAIHAENRPGGGLRMAIRLPEAEEGEKYEAHSHH